MGFYLVLFETFGEAPYVCVWHARYVRLFETEWHNLHSYALSSTSRYEDKWSCN